MIPLDGRAHVAAPIRTQFGDSRGYWDGNLLVVETMNIHPDMTANGASGRTLRASNASRASQQTKWSGPSRSTMR